MNPKPTRRNRDLSDQLEAYSASARSHSAVWKRRVRRWTPYAAAVGSSLALTTAADAAVIYSGPLNSTVHAANSGSTNASVKKLAFGPVSFSQQARFVPNPGNSTGFVGLFPKALGVLLSSHGVKRLNSGQKISAGAGMFGRGGYRNLASGFRNYGPKYGGGKFYFNTGVNGNFSPLPATGFVGFSFSTHSQTDYGWIRLQVKDTDGSNLPNTLVVADLAYDDSGAPVLAGSITAVPEPNSAALALLAAGAIGVLAWRKQRAKGPKREGSEQRQAV